MISAFGRVFGRHFLVFPECFQKASFSESLKVGIVWKRVKPFPKQALVFTCLQNKSFENTAGKGEMAWYEQILLLSVFSTPLDNILPLSSNLKLLSANPLNLEESKICHLGKGKIESIL